MTNRLLLEDIPNRISDKMPDRMSENATYRITEDLADQKICLIDNFDRRTGNFFLKLLIKEKLFIIEQKQKRELIFIFGLIKNGRY